MLVRSDYDPNTGKFTNLVDADGFEYLKNIDSIVYFKRLLGDDNPNKTNNNGFFGVMP